MTHVNTYHGDIDSEDIDTYAAVKAAGKCRTVAPSVMYPSNASDLPRAKAVCYDCPVSGTCLDLALKYGEYGVWGGTGESDRRRMRRSIRIKVRAA